MRDDFLIYADDSVTAYQFFIRLVTLILCSALIGFGYFGRFSISTLIGNIVFSGISAVLITLFDGGSLLICYTVICLLIGTAYVILSVQSNSQKDIYSDTSVEDGEDIYDV